MKLARFGAYREERPAIVTDGGQRLDLSAHFKDWNNDFLAGDSLELLKQIVEHRANTLPRVPDHERWGAPIARPGKVICIGLNYRDHAEETGAAIPTEPIIFMKAPNTVVGPYDQLVIPRGSEKTDWEVELGIVISREARYLESAGSARDHIAGYVLSHDVSERAFQLERGGQWTKGKSCDSFNPLGPFLLTYDAIKDVNALEMELRVNGERRQHGSTKNMIFGPSELVHYISQFMTLEPGDLISTGTPPGVGLGMKPPQYLKPGDIVDLKISQLGSQCQLCVSAE